MFYENVAYFDYDNVLANLKNLKINYVPDLAGTVSGDYHSDVENSISVINIYGCNGVSGASIAVLTHEFCHALESPTREPLAAGLYEIVNTKFNNDYFGANYVTDDDYDHGYITIQKSF